MKLILVEDNADLAWSMHRLLELRGYAVQCFLNAGEFLRQAAAYTDDDLLITDYYLPDLNGIQLLKQVRLLRPGLRAILLTGSREDGIVNAARQMPGCWVEFKPLDYDALHQRICEVRSGGAASLPA